MGKGIVNQKTVSKEAVGLDIFNNKSIIDDETSRKAEERKMRKAAVFISYPNEEAPASRRGFFYYLSTVSKDSPWWR